MSMRARVTAFVLLPILLVAGCSSTRYLMPTPNLYSKAGREPFGELDPSLATSRVDLLYVTDRLLELDGAGHVHYGYGRDRSLGFGSAVVTIGTDVSWEELARASRTTERKKKLLLTLATPTEIHRFPATPFDFTIEGNGLVEDAESREAMARAKEALRAEVLRRLARTPKKEVLLYIHGFNNDFDETAFDLAEIWHFMGREGVPILYSWPAGYGGAAGYGYDRESGEFTVLHLKQLLRALADIPEVERIQILAHSRGTDVITSALRELFIETWASGESARKRFRIANLVLAAPDLDAEVAGQRLFGEKVGLGVGRLTIYASQGDKALGFAETLFGSIYRLGRASEETLPIAASDYIHRQDYVDIVDNQVSADFFGHGYFHSHPASSSDLILVLRYDLQAGTEHGRPLKPGGANIWVLTEDYPAAR